MIVQYRFIANLHDLPFRVVTYQVIPLPPPKKIITDVIGEGGESHSLRNVSGYILDRIMVDQLIQIKGQVLKCKCKRMVVSGDRAERLTYSVVLSSVKADLKSSFEGIDDAPYLLQVIPNWVIFRACGSMSIPLI